MAGTVHVVGAGMAGLACAVRLAEQGRRVVLHEAAGHAGGRCRSFDDDKLGCRIDNGNHLLLSGNRSARAFLRTIGAEGSLTGPARAEFPFVDLANGARWTVRPNRGPLPWWVFAPGRRVPGTGVADYLRVLRLATARPWTTVRQALGDGPAFRCFWEPLVVAVLNTAPEEAAAAPLWPMLCETIGRGEAHARPLLAREGLSETFVDPALSFLRAHGAEIRFNDRLRGIVFADGRAGRLDFAGAPVVLGKDDRVVITVPAHVAADLLPGIEAPDRFRSIVNLHFRLDRTVPVPGLLGVVGGTAQWVFRRRDLASVTVSAADALVDRPAADLAERLWPEVVRALGLENGPIPPWRVIKEKRATIAQTPAQTARRPACRGPWGNLRLAGDWTATGLPATIEGAIRSGRRAAEDLLAGF